MDSDQNKTIDQPSGRAHKEVGKGKGTTKSDGKKAKWYEQKFNWKKRSAYTLVVQYLKQLLKRIELMLYVI